MMYPKGLKLGTVIRVKSNNRIGTICWHHLDGHGGVWGVHNFSHIVVDFSEDLPRPEFMLRNKDVEEILRSSSRWTGGRNDVECVGIEYEILEPDEYQE